MGEHLEDVKLWGERSNMPGIPNRQISGAFSAEANALIFRSQQTDFSLMVSWEQIKNCYPYSCPTAGVGALVTSLLTLTLIDPNDWYMRLTWYSSDHDMDMTVDFYVGTSNGSFLAERRATTLAKSIWTYRSETISRLRLQTRQRTRWE